MGCPFRRSNSKPFWKKLKGLFRRSTESMGTLSSENLVAILDATDDSIITINQNRIILAFNKAAENSFGYLRQEVIGKNVHILMPEPFHSEHDSYVQNYLRTGEKKIIGIGREVVAKRKDGSNFPIALSVSEVFTGEDRLFIGIIRDLTEAKKAEESLKSQIRLESEIAIKNEYISILSHELRTPLTAIYGALSLLNPDKSVSEKTHELINVAFRNAERLSRIINAVLDITKIQSGKVALELSSFSVGELIQEALLLSKPSADQLNVELIYSNSAFDVTIRSDYTKLIQVMMNLLSNAIKFSPRQGKVIVTVQSTENNVRVSIQDFGKGVPAGFQNKLFTPFSQSTSGAHIAGGSGLGLYICKLIIETLNGKIGFTTKENEGTIFFFELPAEIGAACLR